MKWTAENCNFTEFDENAHVLAMEAGNNPVNEVRKFNVSSSRGVNASLATEPMADKYATGAHARRGLQQFSFGDLVAMPDEEIRSEGFLFMTEVCDAKVNVFIWTHKDL